MRERIPESRQLDPDRRHIPAQRAGVAVRDDPAGREGVLRLVQRPRGVNGRKINFKFLDDGYDPSQTVPLTRQLVERDHVFAMFNSLGTAPQLAVRGYLNSAQGAAGPVATGDSYWGSQYKAYPWTIGYQPDYPGEGEDLRALHPRPRPRRQDRRPDAERRLRQELPRGPEGGPRREEERDRERAAVRRDGSRRHPADARAQGFGRERLHGLRDADAVDQVARHRDEDRLEARRSRSSTTSRRP